MTDLVEIEISELEGDALVYATGLSMLKYLENPVTLNKTPIDERARQIILHCFGDTVSVPRCLVGGE